MLATLVITIFIGYTVIGSGPSPFPSSRENLDLWDLRENVQKQEAHSFQQGGPRLSDIRLTSSSLQLLLARRGRNKHNGKWEAFGPGLDKEGYVYSAFYDDRKSLGTFPVVRLIGVAEEFTNNHFQCLLSYPSRPDHVTPLKVGDIGAGVNRHDKLFKEYIFTCHLYHEDIPENVSIVKTFGDKPNFIMPVEIAARPLRRDAFGCCVSVAYWHHNPYQIVEWMEMLRMLGVSKVTVYNNSLEKEAARVFLWYDRQGFVDFRQSHNFIRDPGELSIHMHMSPVINDCMYRNMYRFKKMVVTDLDELIIPRTVDNYTDLMVVIDQKQGVGNHHQAKHYVFTNDYFFLDFPGEDTGQVAKLTTLRHRKRIEPSEQGYAIKSIISPLACARMHNHYCWGITELYDTEGNTIEVDPKLALNQHYKRCHLDLWEKPGMCLDAAKRAIQDDIMLKYKDRLLKAVSEKLLRIGLPPL